MKKYGLLGKKLGHSFSPLIHRELGGYEYGLFEKSEAELENFVKSGEWDGLNVTIPYKQSVIPFCSHLSETAREIGSVNTLVRSDSGEIFGDNTDIAGFNYMLDRLDADVKGKKALVLGSGGASKTAVYALKKRGADVIVISRSGENNYDNISKHYDAGVIVNTTPLGMYPNTELAALDLEEFTSCSAVLDLIYNPARTRLLMQAESLEIKYAGGLSMLVEQAARACELFTDTAIPQSETERVIKLIAGGTQNIVLIGMPGCGKTTIGRLIAEKTGRSFADLDDEVVRLAGTDIPSIFAEQGEDAFRALETKALCETAKKSSLVIAAGGGVVTRNANYLPLHSNSVIVYLKREVSQLPTDGRPLSQKHSPQKLAEVRLPLYEKWADVELEVTTPDETAENVLKIIENRTESFIH